MSGLLEHLQLVDVQHRTIAQAIVELVRMDAPITRCEVERRLALRSNQVSGRVHELLTNGLLITVGETRCALHDARGTVELLDVPRWLRIAGRQQRLDAWGVEA